MRRGIYLFLGFIFIFLGAIFVLNSFSSITGLAVVEDVPKKASGFVGILFFSSGIMLIYFAKKEKKAQAAMEFLMTYGWAILAAIVAVGALAYFGIFTVRGDNSAILSPPLTAGSISVNNPGSSSQNDVSFEVTNGGKQIVITEANIENLPAGSTCQPLTNLNIPLTSGEKTTITISCNNLVASQGRLSVKYITSGSTITQLSAGTVNLNPSTGPGSTGGTGGTGGGDTTPPVITLVSIGGDSSSPYSTNDNTPLIVASTNENAGCRWSLSDIAYMSMGNPCSSGNGLMHNCQLGSFTDGNNNAYVACIDAAGNGNTAGNNLDAGFEVDTLAPVQSGWNPANGTSILVPAFINITFNTNENAMCQFSIDDGGSFANCGTIYAMNQACNNVYINGPLFSAIKVIILCTDDTNVNPNSGTAELFYTAV